MNSKPPAWPYMDKKLAVLQIRLTPGELRAVRTYCVAQGKTASELIRAYLENVITRKTLQK